MNTHWLLGGPKISKLQISAATLLMTSGSEATSGASEYAASIAEISKCENPTIGYTLFANDAITHESSVNDSNLNVPSSSSSYNTMELCGQKTRMVTRASLLDIETTN